jgi:hypothetical protein
VDQERELSRLARPATAWAVGAVITAMFVGEFPLAHLVHQYSNLSGDPLALAFAPIGLLVAVRRPQNPIGWTFLLAGLFAELDEFCSLYTVAVYRDHHPLPFGPLAVLLQPSWAPAIVLFGVAIQLFPTGHLPPGRWRWPLYGFVAVGAVWIAGTLVISTAALVHGTVRITAGGDLDQLDHPTGAAASWGVLQVIFFAGFAVTIVAWLARVVPRYRRSAGEERQQLKLLIVGAVVAGTGGFLTVSLSGSGGVAGFVGKLATVAICALPVSLGVGVLRFRLYEIDRLISRTISYVLLTGTLVAVFVGLVALTTGVLPFSSPVGVAASTLAAAALFNPIRGRSQRIVDRRFNRARYDAERTIAEFAQRLREAVDVDSVQSGLLDAIAHAVEPSQLSIWVRSES